MTEKWTAIELEETPAMLRLLNDRRREADERSRNAERYQALENCFKRLAECMR